MKIGIDLGTKNSLVFIPHKGVVLNEPSVVAVSLTENKILAVGKEAKEMIGRTPDTIQIFRPLKEGVIADYRSTQAMLKHFIDKVNTGLNRFFKPELLVGVPAGITSTEKERLLSQEYWLEPKKFIWLKSRFFLLLAQAFPLILLPVI